MRSKAIRGRPRHVSYQNCRCVYGVCRLSAFAAMRPVLARRADGHFLADLEPRKDEIAMVAAVAAADRHTSSAPDMCSKWDCGARNVHLGAIALGTMSAALAHFSGRFRGGMAEAVGSERHQWGYAALARRSSREGYWWKEVPGRAPAARASGGPTARPCPASSGAGQQAKLGQHLLHSGLKTDLRRSNRQRSGARMRASLRGLVARPWKPGGGG